MPLLLEGGRASRIWSGEDTQSACKHFTSVSPDRSGHFRSTVGAPMLGRSPLADMVPSKQAPTRELWIGRALVRSQRGTSKAVATGRRFSLPRVTTSESRRNTGLGVPVPPVAIVSQLRPA